MAGDPQRIVSAGYDAAAERYAELERPDRPWPRMRWLRELLDRLPPGAEVLDLGCASGRPAAAEIAKQYQVTGVDISRHQISLAKRNVPEGTFICADAATIDFPDGRFDAVVSFYTFDHIPRDEHGELFARIYRWLRPGGWLLVSIEDADQAGVVGSWLGVEMFFSMFDADTTRRLVRGSGFELERTTVETQAEQGRQIPYLWILASKPGERLG